MDQGQSGNPATKHLIPVGRRDRARAGLLLASAAAVALVLAVWHPAGWIPVCPTFKYGGVYCPGCGSMRASHHLLNGSVGMAFRHNPLLVLAGLPLAVWFWAEQMTVLVIGFRFRPMVRLQLVGWVALVVLVGFAILRNIPSASFDGWRPPVAADHSEP